jgi:hypothetical protein
MQRINKIDNEGELPEKLTAVYESDNESTHSPLQFSHPPSYMIKNIPVTNLFFFNVIISDFHVLLSQSLVTPAVSARFPRDRELLSAGHSFFISDLT